MRKLLLGERPFQIIKYACGQFILLTLIAMLTYAGGTANDPTAAGYQFFHNFFSDLGMTKSHSGAGNMVSAVLFFVALTGAGLSLIIFSVIMPQFFKARRGIYWLSWLGSLFGLVAGIGYAGVAFTPANLLLGAHIIFVQVAFLSFFVAALIYTLVIWATATYSNRYAAVFAVFTMMLAVYIWLLFFGPGLDTANGLAIQVTGQKIIGYASLISVFIQADEAQKQRHMQGKTAVYSPITSLT